MNQDLHIALCKHLMKTLRKCDHSHHITSEFLTTRSTDLNKDIRWLEEHGGYCDCEVIFNTMP